MRGEKWARQLDKDAFTNDRQEDKWVERFVRFLHEESGGKPPLQTAYEILKAKKQIETAVEHGYVDFITKLFYSLPMPLEMVRACHEDEGIRAYIARLLYPQMLGP
jgi:hypothetical protein